MKRRFFLKLLGALPFLKFADLERFAEPAGLDHLEGEHVEIITDGTFEGQRVETIWSDPAVKFAELKAIRGTWESEWERIRTQLKPSLSSPIDPPQIGQCHAAPYLSLGVGSLLLGIL